MSGKLTLKEARENMNFSQKAIAEKVGVQPATIRRWEKGETKIRAIEFLLFCKACGISPNHVTLKEV